jgi:biotin carboxyl carrier protein
VRYFVQISGTEHVVDLTPRPDGSVSARVGERDVAVDTVTFSTRTFSARVDGRVLDLAVEGHAPQLGVVASGLRTYVSVESERARTASRAASSGGARAQREVRAPMPGRVVKVLVAQGDAVTAGTSLVIIEAMKMENEVRAKGDGVVAKIHVAAGATVEGNAVLLTFEG